MWEENFGGNNGSTRWTLRILFFREKKKNSNGAKWTMEWNGAFNRLSWSTQMLSNMNSTSPTNPNIPSAPKSEGHGL